MTTQAKDKVCLRDREYALMGRSNGTLYEPIKVGVRPVTLHTGNWRGYICRFAIEDGALFLEGVEVNSKLADLSPENVPLLLGKAPEASWMNDWLKSVGIDYLTVDSDIARLIYSNLGEFVPYTGAVILTGDWLGRDSSPGIYPQPHPAFRYADVRELVLVEGRITEEYDRSPALAVIRERALAMTSDERERDYRQIHEQIYHCFLQEPDYTLL